MNQIILPTYLCYLPSSEKSVKFRPFTVKEEKALLLALEENDLKIIAQALKNTVSLCTFGVVDTETTPYYDIEYLFLKIRSKSVGELIELVGSCDCSDTAKTGFAVDINSMVIEPKNVLGKQIIRIPDTKYSLEMRHPSLDDYVLAIDDQVNAGTNTVAKCILGVYTDDEVFNWTYEQKCEFIESMTPKQQKDIAKFLDDMPIVKLDASYKCNKCGKEHTKYLSGFENFFV